MAISTGSASRNQANRSVGVTAGGKRPLPTNEKRMIGSGDGLGPSSDYAFWASRSMAIRLRLRKSILPVPSTGRASTLMKFVRGGI